MFPSLSFQSIFPNGLAGPVLAVSVPYTSGASGGASFYIIGKNI
jgi:hypothetical protein